MDAIQLKALADQYRKDPEQAKIDLKPSELKEVEAYIAQEDKVVDKAKTTKVVTNESLGETPTKDLDFVDYEKEGGVKGADFKKYLAIEKRLDRFKKYQFAEYKIEALFTMRFQGIQGSPRDVSGFRLKDKNPVKTTLITPFEAARLNGLDVETDQEDASKFFIRSAQFAVSGRIYVLAKSKKK